ncbi:hypothetical protein BDZ45DRAFT_742071 [Acephala macrosclerotiorum]|nr:hypothetical protein BDZ45DRAFT_742071 [Acephala macrosclerotiorum]
MHFTTITLLAVLIPLISAQYRKTDYQVSACDGTDLGTYSGTPATLAGPTCVTWTDPMVVYAEPNCQVDAEIYPGGCYVNVGSFAAWCSETPAK